MNYQGRPLPNGWVEHFDQHNQPYYVNLNTRPPTISSTHPGDILPPSHNVPPTCNAPPTHNLHSRGPAKTPFGQAETRTHQPRQPSYAQQLYANAMSSVKRPGSSSGPTSPTIKANINTAVPLQTQAVPTPSQSSSPSISPNITAAPRFFNNVANQGHVSRSPSYDPPGLEQLPISFQNINLNNQGQQTSQVSAFSPPAQNFLGRSRGSSESQQTFQTVTPPVRQQSSAPSTGITSVPHSPPSRQTQPLGLQASGQTQPHAHARAQVSQSPPVQQPYNATSMYIDSPLSTSPSYLQSQANNDSLTSTPSYFHPMNGRTTSGPSPAQTSGVNSAPAETPSAATPSSPPVQFPQGSVQSFHPGYPPSHAPTSRPPSRHSTVASTFSDRSTQSQRSSTTETIPNALGSESGVGSSRPPKGSPRQPNVLRKKNQVAPFAPHQIYSLSRVGQTQDFDPAVLYAESSTTTLTTTSSISQPSQYSLPTYRDSQVVSTQAHSSSTSGPVHLFWSEDDLPEPVPITGQHTAEPPQTDGAAQPQPKPKKNKLRKAGSAFALTHATHSTATLGSIQTGFSRSVLEKEERTPVNARVSGASGSKSHVPDPSNRQTVHETQVWVGPRPLPQVQTSARAPAIAQQPPVPKSNLPAQFSAHPPYRTTQQPQIPNLPAQFSPSEPTQQPQIPNLPVRLSGHSPSGTTQQPQIPTTTPTTDSHQYNNTVPASNNAQSQPVAQYAAYNSYTNHQSFNVGEISPPPQYQANTWPTNTAPATSQQEDFTAIMAQMQVFGSANSVQSTQTPANPAQMNASPVSVPMNQPQNPVNSSSPTSMHYGSNAQHHAASPSSPAQTMPAGMMAPHVSAPVQNIPQHQIQQGTNNWKPPGAQNILAQAMNQALSAQLQNSNVGQRPTFSPLQAQTNKLLSSVIKGATEAVVESTLTAGANYLISGESSALFEALGAGEVAAGLEFEF
ncbi:hypothetical protein FA15DRAFT_751674 [Coprinopsis marcescibilis]|uniref:WW domain-containing protein n=1 Tax=Coprinopsis marcescibilis TaxID=230819 RepID=A0A5C3LDD1_COPMA|nr:hypothetical protein FA15DRAFT_751674 [Coprinopsis marcescibilis]